MKRLLRLSAPLLAVAAMLTVVSITKAQDEQITLTGVNLGAAVHGPAVTANDLSGKVVVFEYWGDRCGPCIRAIPHLAEVRGEYTTDQLMIVANQVWTQDINQARTAWTNAGGGNGISVVNHGAIQGVQVRGVPHSFIFDHEGNLLWRGHPASAEFDTTIAAAVAALPAAEPAEAE